MECAFDIPEGPEVEETGGRMMGGGGLDGTGEHQLSVNRLISDGLCN